MADDPFSGWPRDDEEKRRWMLCGGDGGWTRRGRSGPGPGSSPSSGLSGRAADTAARPDKKGWRSSWGRKQRPPGIIMMMMLTALDTRPSGEGGESSRATRERRRRARGSGCSGRMRRSPCPRLTSSPALANPQRRKGREKEKRKEKKTRCRKLTARVCWHRILCRFDGVDPVRVQVLSQGARSGDPAAPWFFSAQHEQVALTSQSACSSILCLDALIGYGKY